jgi:hypothetical protein
MIIFMVLGITVVGITLSEVAVDEQGWWQRQALMEFGLRTASWKAARAADSWRPVLCTESVAALWAEVGVRLLYVS